MSETTPPPRPERRGLFRKKKPQQPRRPTQLPPRISRATSDGPYRDPRYGTVEYRTQPTPPAPLQEGEEFIAPSYLLDRPVTPEPAPHPAGYVAPEPASVVPAPLDLEWDEPPPYEPPTPLPTNPVDPRRDGPGPEPILEPPSDDPPRNEADSTDTERLRFGLVHYDASSHRGNVRKSNQDGYLTPVGSYLPEGDSREDAQLQQPITIETQRQQAEQLATVLSSLSLPDIPTSAAEILSINQSLQRLISEGHLQGLGVLADGAGGQASGERASSIALIIVNDYIVKHVQNEPNPEKLLKDAILKADAVLGGLNKHEQIPGDNSMASTILITLTTKDGNTLGASVGDSRIYERDITTGKTILRTTGGSVVWEVLTADNSHLLPSEYFAHALRSKITTGVNDGELRADEINIFQTTLDGNKELILASDGAWELGSQNDPRFAAIDARFSQNVARGMSREAAAQLAYGEFFQLINCGNRTGRLSAEYLTRQEIQTKSGDNATVVIYEPTTSPERKTSNPPPKRPPTLTGGAAVELQFDPEDNPQEYVDAIVRQIRDLPPNPDPDHPQDVFIEYYPGPEIIRDILNELDIDPESDDIQDTLTGIQEHVDNDTPFAIVFRRLGQNEFEFDSETGEDLAEMYLPHITDLPPGMIFVLPKTNPELLADIFENLQVRNLDDSNIDNVLEQLAELRETDPNYRLVLANENGTILPVVASLITENEDHMISPNGILEQDLIFNPDWRVYTVQSVNPDGTITVRTTAENPRTLSRDELEQWRIVTPDTLTQFIQNSFPEEVGNRISALAEECFATAAQQEINALDTSQFFLAALSDVGSRQNSQRRTSEEIDQYIEVFIDPTADETEQNQRRIFIKTIYDRLQALFPPVLTA